jgi:O-antigen/teichoic acid export membrane protein
LQLLLLLIQGIRVGHLSLKPDWSFVTRPFLREMLIYGWTVFLAGIASMAIKLLDSVILGQMVPLALVGVYGIAAFIPTFIEAPLNALDKVANVRVSQSWEKNDMENIKDIYYKSARYLFLLGGFLFLMVTINAPFLFKWLPDTYYQGVPVVAILSLSSLFNLMTGSNTAIIFNSNRFTSGALALVCVAILNLVMLYALIPIWGLEGAAWATCLSSLAYNLFKYLFIYLRFKLQPFDKRTLYIAIAIAFTYAIIQFLPLFESVILNIAVQTIVASFIYGLLIWFSRAADDLKQLLPFFKNKQ